jgi:hypothetical protein
MRLAKRHPERVGRALAKGFVIVLGEVPEIAEPARESHRGHAGGWGRLGQDAWFITLAYPRLEKVQCRISTLHRQRIHK